MFTRVLKGHIALDRQCFPPGTPGCLLDTLARQYLWQFGRNYLHGECDCLAGLTQWDAAYGPTLPSRASADAHFIFGVSTNMTEC